MASTSDSFNSVHEGSCQSLVACLELDAKGGCTGHAENSNIAMGKNLNAYMANDYGYSAYSRMLLTDSGHACNL